MGRTVDLDDLVDAEAVARYLGLSSRNAVSVYRQRYTDFPDPVIVTGRCMLWLRGDVESWLATRRS